MKIGVVIVTYNRLEKLKIALKNFSEQTKLPEYLVVVNNSSTDGTREFLNEWSQKKEHFEKYVIETEYNSGGSGGFYTGLEKAMKLNAEWIWLSDDDAFPEKNALKEASLFLEKNEKNIDDISAICGEVIRHGEIDLSHRKNMLQNGLKVTEEYCQINDYSKESFELNCFSYVGTIVNREKLRKVGLTNKEFFLWWDDTEHSLRLSKVGRILCVPRVKIHHDVPKSKTELSWKTYYGYRNMTYLYKKHFPKKCYYYFFFKMMYKTYMMDFKGENKEQNKVIRESLRDCRKENFGIHKVYKPGWKPKE